MVSTRSARARSAFGIIADRAAGESSQPRSRDIDHEPSVVHPQHSDAQCAVPPTIRRVIAGLLEWGEATYRQVKSLSRPGGGGIWSFWTAFEHEFDENELKRAQTRTISTKMRSK